MTSNYQLPDTAPDWLSSSLILITEVGSRAHGTNAEDGQDDNDHMGICVEPPRYVTGLDRFEQYTWRTQPEGVKSKAGDLDLTIYSLRKWLRLAMKGNPSILVPMMVSDEWVYYKDENKGFRSIANYLRSTFDDLAWNRIASKLAGAPFLGYLRAQRDRLQGVRGGRHGGKGRPELESKYGYDTKFAMHMLRLGISGVQYMTEGRFDEPIQGSKREFLRGVRAGALESKEDCLIWANTWENLLIQAIDNSPLPEQPDWDWANHFLHAAYTRVWETNGWT